MRLWGFIKWKNRTYRSELLPEVNFTATLPSYHKGYNSYQQNDGSYTYVQNNYMQMNGQLSIDQNIWFTGGTLSLNTSLDFLRQMDGSSGNRFMSVPLALTLNQPVFGVNQTKWDRRIEPVRYAEAKAAFLSATEEVTMTTINYFFNLLLARENVAIARQNLENAEKLYEVAKAKRRMGQISENDVLQLKLNVLDARSSLTSNESALKSHMFTLRSFLALGENEELIPEVPDSVPEVRLEYADVLSKALANNSFAQNIRRRQLEADYEVAKAKGNMREIERIIGKKFIQGEMPTGKQICEKQLLKVIDELEKVKVNEDEICDFMPDIYRKLDWLSKEDLIKRMVSHEFNRFLDYYRNREEIEIATGSGRNGKGRERSGSTRQAAPGFKRLFINLGKMDNFFPNELISLLNSNTRGRIELGRIDLMQKFSFFEVEEKEVGNVVKALNRANWNGRKVSVEIAGEEGKDTPKGKRRSEGGSYGKKEFDGKKRSNKDDRRSESTGKRNNKSEYPATDKKKSKPSREERGYTKARGKKDDWKQFFQGNNEFKDSEPDFSEEGWARRTPKKK